MWNINEYIYTRENEVYRDWKGTLVNVDFETNSIINNYNKLTSRMITTIN